MQTHHSNSSILERSSKTKPDISILCSTYNQEKYIAQAIESFLAQKTSFSFEIIIHDDASTDDTQKILRDYYEAHNDKLTIIIQQENQYSKGGFEPVLVEASHAKADTLMLCDGDDYWLDNNKLQHQYERYSSFPDVELAFHPVYKEFPDGGKELFCKHFDTETIVSTNRIIRGTGGFCPTPSILISKKALLSIPSDVSNITPVGDVFFQIFGAVKGGALYLPEPMSIYRIHSSTSVSTALSKSTREEQLRFNINLAKAYRLTRKKLPLKHFFSLTKMERKYRIKKNRKLKNI